jgi:endonuclease-3
MVKGKTKSLLVNSKDWNSLYSFLKNARGSFEAPVDTRISETTSQVNSEDYRFSILIKMIIGAQMRENLSAKKLEALKVKGLNVERFLKTSEEDLIEELTGISYHKKKAKYVKKTCEMLEGEFEGKVPLDYKSLISLPGIGSRSANMLLTILGKPSNNMIVDANIHRISNRLGIISTDNPNQTEKELSKIIPKDLTKEFYVNLLGFAQVYCKPKAPDCKSCPASAICNKVGLEEVRNHSNSRK